MQTQTNTWTNLTTIMKPMRYSMGRQFLTKKYRSVLNNNQNRKGQIFLSIHRSGYK